MNTITGIDIGGTHITVCNVNLTTFQTLTDTRHRSPINGAQCAHETITSWAAAIRTVHQPGTPIGIAMPGPFDYDTGISLIKGQHKYESLYGLNVKEMLAESLQISPGHIRLMNDASAFLYGEVNSASTHLGKHVAGITLGTGLGSAVYRNQKTEEGDLWCMPYRQGTAEDYLSARWFVQEYTARTGNSVENVKEIALLYPTDSAARALFEECGRYLGEVLVSRFAAAFPEHVIVGGNIARSWLYMAPACEAVIAAEGFSCTLSAARLGEDAALIGAACLWL